MAASERVRQYITDNLLFGQPDSLGDGDSFLDRGILDSTGVLELIGFLEGTFGISISNEEMIPENLDSIEKIDAFIQRKTAPQVG
jgi:acyl carrier protein